MAKLSDLDSNYLLVSDTRCFLVTAACHHPNFFVGTRRTMYLKLSPGAVLYW